MVRRAFATRLRSGSPSPRYLPSRSPLAGLRPRVVHSIWLVGCLGAVLLGTGTVFVAYGLFPTWFGVLPSSTCPGEQFGLVPWLGLAAGALLLLGGAIAWFLTLGQSLDPAARADPSRGGRRFLLPHTLTWVASVLYLGSVLAVVTVMIVSATGYTASTKGAPGAISFLPGTAATCSPASAPPLRTYSFPIQVTSGLTTDQVGFGLANGTQTVIASGLAPGSGSCPALPNATGTWVMVVLSGNGAALAAYGDLGWEPVGTSHLPLTFTDTMSVALVAKAPLTGDVLTVRGTGCGTTVTGTVQF